MQIWTEYADYLLGRFVLGVLGGVDGAAVGDSDWQVVLDYEHEIRREMTVRMLAGAPLEPSLRLAWSDPVVRDRFLISPLQRRSISKRSAPPPGGERQNKHQRKNEHKEEQRQGGKGNGGGKGKGKKRNDGAGKEGTRCARATPSGSPICFGFNNRDGCKRGAGCPFAHVCGVCFASGVPLFECSHSKKA